jgi:hypothetical protein
MEIELLSKRFLSEKKRKSENYPKCVYDHINTIISERDILIEEEEEENSDEEEKEFMKLKRSDFRILVWMIDNCEYYDIHHFKDDAEVGFIMKYDDGKLIKICQIDEAALDLFDDFKHMKEWCDNFEKERIRILEY